MFGLLNFGLVQADAVADEMVERFDQITAQLDLYPAIDHIRSRYRFSSYKSQSIYYRVDYGDVLVVRILHQQMEPLRQFESLE